MNLDSTFAVSLSLAERERETVSQRKRKWISAGGFRFWLLPSWITHTYTLHSFTYCAIFQVSNMPILLVIQRCIASPISSFLRCSLLQYHRIWLKQMNCAARQTYLQAAISPELWQTELPISRSRNPYTSRRWRSMGNINIWKIQKGEGLFRVTWHQPCYLNDKVRRILIGCSLIETFTATCSLYIYNINMNI